MLVSVVWGGGGEERIYVQMSVRLLYVCVRPRARVLSTYVMRERACVLGGGGYPCIRDLVHIIHC